MLISLRQFLERNKDDSSAMMWRNSVTMLISLPVTVSTTGMALSTVSGLPSVVHSMMPDFNSIDLGIPSFLNVSTLQHSTQHSEACISYPCCGAYLN